MVSTQGPICLESRPKKLPKKGGRARKAEIRPYLKDDIDRKKSTLFFAILLEHHNSLGGGFLKFIDNCFCQ